MDDVFVRLKDLPCKINAMTILDSDGDYNVYINAKLDSAAAARAYDHEMIHIKRGDFYNSLSIREAENI